MTPLNNKWKNRDRKLKHFGAKSILPNMITILALSVGATAIRFAMEERWDAAVLAIVIAGVLDGMDGSVARLLKSTSRFGAELDSLSDVVAFGVAPGVLLYMWSIQALGGLGWVIALAFTICCALRLARYNSNLDVDDEPRKKAGFLTGLPAPVAAGLALLPVMAASEYGQGFYTNPEFVGLYSAAICFGMISKFPTYAFRTLMIRKEYLVYTLLLFGLFAASVTAYGWQMLIIAGLFYILSVPVSVYRFYALSKKA
ncbi:MAG: phosphatidylcholine/phosphatidylserine synthase [Proteobacteria bacterium]|nr:phosphatidylcholine/phosphatidylserine synthase [Pseudomonadota bacterium]